MKKVCIFGECEQDVQDATDHLLMNGWKTSPANIVPSAPQGFYQALFLITGQENCLVETAVTSELRHVLTRAPVACGIGSVINELTEFLTISQLCCALGVDAGKSSPALEVRIRDWLDQEGWERVKTQVNGVRIWGYQRPANTEKST